MHKFILFLKDFRFYNKKQLKEAILSFTGHKKVILLLGIIFSFILFIILLGKLNSMFMVEIPVSGGTITEGIIGTPTLINPVIAFSYADKDITSLIYSGLMRKQNDGTFIPDLAEEMSMSGDGLTYTFTLKKNIKFHNGDKITVDDIIFTINKIKDPIIKSPKQAEWNGVTIDKKDGNTIIFTLVKPSISFIDNTTFGILPANLWKDVNVNEFNLSPLNIKAIGSGPYKFDSVEKNKDGMPSVYHLVRFNKFILGKPLIEKINIISFANEKDLIKSLINNTITQAGGISPENTESIETGSLAIHTAVLPRVVGLFFNKNNNKIFTDQNIINAIDLALDRKEFIDTILSGYGSIIHNIIPERIISDNKLEKYKTSNIEEANKILDNNGWIIGEDGIRVKNNTTIKKVNGKNTIIKGATPAIRLSFSIITGDTPELKNSTELIKKQLKQVGIEVDIEKIYETGQLNQLIKAREYEALFFGEIINHESDLYSYLHSSQINDPGLNISMYNNNKIDIILESIQKTLKYDDRINKYKNLLDEYNKNIGSVLIYSPHYLYITKKNFNNITFNNITIPQDRFNEVYKWSVDTDNVWKIFTK